MKNKNIFFQKYFSLKIIFSKKSFSLKKRESLYENKRPYYQVRTKGYMLY